jgi:hypothetical protein
MKSISASIIVLSGAIVLSAGGLVTHSDTSLFMMFAGGIVGLIGLYGWWVSVQKNE